MPTCLQMYGFGADPDSPTNQTYTYVPLTDPTALCLDGSPYGVYICQGTDGGTGLWMIGIQGGGWCYNET